MAGNLFGEFTGIGKGRLTEPETGYQYPEFAEEAAARSSAVQEAMEKKYDIPPPEGFLQHLAGALGTMGAQIPAPTSLAGGVGALTKMLPKTVHAATAPVRAALELADPLIVPSRGNYAAGAAFGAGLGSGMEHAGEALMNREMEELYGPEPGEEEKELNSLAVQRHVAQLEKEERQEYLRPRVLTVVAESWDELPVEDQMELLSSEYAQDVWDTLSLEQQEELREEILASEESQEGFAKGGSVNKFRKAAEEYVRLHNEAAKEYKKAFKEVGANMWRDDNAHEFKKPSLKKAVDSISETLGTAPEVIEIARPLTVLDSYPDVTPAQRKLLDKKVNEIANRYRQLWHDTKDSNLKGGR
jgi:hypothetical protein